MCQYFVACRHVWSNDSCLLQMCKNCLLRCFHLERILLLHCREARQAGWQKQQYDLMGIASKLTDVRECLPLASFCMWPLQCYLPADFQMSTLSVDHRHYHRRRLACYPYLPGFLIILLFRRRAQPVHQRDSSHRVARPASSDRFFRSL